jgi:lipopolysaccharide export system ATP-binding protein
LSKHLLDAVGLTKSYRGKRVVNGVNIHMYERARRGLGYLSQEPSVFRKMTVADNVRAVLETLDLPKHQREERLQHLLDGLGLTPLAQQKAVTLSGGERRRLEITRALVTNPRILMLDEPFSGVDPIAVSDVQKIIGQLKDMGLGILITDHNVRETLAIVDRAYLMSEGRILCEGSSEKLINDENAKKFYFGEEFRM